MSRSTALVPVPFYPPVRTGTGSFFNFGTRSTRPLLIEQQVRTVASEPDEGMAYNRIGRVVGNPMVGTLVSIYV